MRSSNTKQNTPSQIRDLGLFFIYLFWHIVSYTFMYQDAMVT